MGGSAYPNGSRRATDAQPAHPCESGFASGPPACHTPSMRFLLLSLLILSAAQTLASPLKPVRPECEFRENPAGIATTTPRLGWRLAAADPGARGLAQSAFQVVAAATPEALAAGAPLLWDSGIVERSSEPVPTRAVYAGTPLHSRDQVHWKVRVWDQNGVVSDWSEPAHFSIGLLAASDWRSDWIGLDDAPAPPLTTELRELLRSRPWVRLSGPPARRQRTAHLRSEFDLPETPIREAFFAGCADMLGELRLNGRSFGELARWEPLAPIDAGPFLRPGRNAFAARIENHDGLNPALTGILFIRFVDGAEARIAPDQSWKLSVEPAAGWDEPGFDDSAWAAPEVSARQPWGSARNTEHFMPRAPFLRTTFIAAKPVRRATLYATALGVYECRLNGERIGDAEFAPGWTEYTKRLEHQTFDVTALLRPGPNCLGAMLGEGWYAGLMGYTGHRRFYQAVGGPSPRFRAQLEVEYADGVIETIATGPHWRAAFGPILHADLYMGSHLDSRLEVPGWDRPDFDDSAWRPPSTGLSPPVPRAADVTERVRAALKEPGASLLVGPQALGDPAYGVVKTLHVQYSAAGEPREVSLREGQHLALPREGDAEPIVITKATFAEPTPAPVNFTIEPARTDPVRRFEELPAKSVSEPRPGRYIFDLGQNMVGWCRVSISGVRGQRITLRHAEFLNPDGTLYTSNLRGATAADFFTLKGGPETLEPPFTFHGFRYVEVTGLASRPDPAMITGIVAHSAMRPAGAFTCSSPLVNQLVHNILWGMKGNYLEVPTDCPQRDERLGWTGDAQFFINTAAYTFDIASFMSRWLNTLAHDAQFDDGTFAHVAPRVNERGGSTAWGDAAIVCTHAMYTTYADARIVEHNYEPMKRYLAWLDSKTTDGIAKVGGFGDWLNLGDPTAPDLIDTAFRAHLYDLMSEMARVVRRNDDAARFAAARDAAAAAFRARFLAPDGSLRESGQTGYALAFTMNLLPPEAHAAASEHFAAAIASKNHHLATGFIGTPRLLPALHAAGRDDLAARLLLNETYPSWLYQVKLGATTMWERWDGWTPERGFSDVGMNSFNHYAFGSVGDYLYRHVAGIAPLAPGYTRIRLAPTITPGLDHASATYDSPSGEIRSAWRRTSQGLSFDITIPPNTTAEIHLPAGPGAVITESSRPLAQSPGLEVLSTAPLRLAAAPGVYSFTIARE